MTFDRDLRLGMLAQPVSELLQLAAGVCAEIGGVELEVDGRERRRRAPVVPRYRRRRAVPVIAIGAVPARTIAVGRPGIIAGIDDLRVPLLRATGQREQRDENEGRSDEFHE